MSPTSQTKVHVGCGTVYLDGYINVDLRIPGVSFKASERPDLVEKNRTSVDRYYNYSVTREDIEQKRLQKGEVVVDVFGDARELPFPAHSLNEILSVQVFEHFTYDEGERLLNHWHSLLKPGAVLHIDVPDLDETLKGYLKSKSEKDKRWFLRLLFGSQKNEFSLHRAMYSKDMLTSILRKHGFHKIRELGNIHFYPAFALKAKKK